MGHFQYKFVGLQIHLTNICISIWMLHSFRKLRVIFTIGQQDSQTGGNAYGQIHIYFIKVKNRSTMFISMNNKQNYKL